MKFSGKMCIKSQEILKVTISRSRFQPLFRRCNFGKITEDVKLSWSIVSKVKLISKGAFKLNGLIIIIHLSIVSLRKEKVLENS